MPLIVCVRGGAIQEIYTDLPDLDVTVITWFGRVADDDAPGRDETRPVDERAAATMLQRWRTTAWAQLAGTDVERAFRAADEILPLAPQRALAPAEHEASGDAPRQPERLSRSALTQIVATLQRLLYLDERDDGPPCWNPDKPWDGAEICDELAAQLDRYGLVPQTEQSAAEPDHYPLN